MNSSERDRLTTRRIARAHRVSVGLGWISFGLGGLVLVGLIVSPQIFTRLHPGRDAMKVNTAIALVLLGGAIGLGDESRRRRIASRGLSALAVLLGFLTLGEYLWGVDLGIDNRWISAEFQRGTSPFPGRMSPITAFNLVVVGLAILFCRSGRRRLQVLGAWLPLIPAVATLLALAGDAYGVQGMYQFQQYSTMAASTSVGLAVLCAGVLLGRADCGPMAVVMGESLGGLMARRMLPIIPVLFFALGWIPLVGGWRGLFSEAFGVALLSTASTVIAAGLVWWTARSLTITESARLSIQNSLWASEARYQQVAEGLPHLVWTCRSDGYCDYLSRQWVDYTGISEAEQLGFDWSRVVHPKDHDRVIQQWCECVKTGSVLDIEFRIRSRTGEYRWFTTRGVPLRNPAGTIIKWFGTNTDIHDAKLQAEALRESESRLRSVLAVARLGHWDLDLKTNRVTDQGGIRSLFGRYEARVLTSLGDYMDTIHPDDQPGLMAALERSVADDAPFEAEFRIVTPDDSIRWLAAKGGVFHDAEGHPVRMAGVIIDVTEKREAEVQIRRLNEGLEHRVAERTAELARAGERLREGEERFRGAFESSAIGMALVAPDGRWVQVNESLCRILGYTEEEFRSRTFQDITHPDDLDSDLEQVRRTLAGETTSYQIEKRYLHKAGHVLWVLLNVSLVRDAQGAPIHFVSQVQDITTRKEFEHELRKARDQAMAATRAKAEFLANMSHEIRTPMNGVIGMTELLSDTQLNDLQRDYVETIRSSGEALLTVINDILDFSKIEAGRMSLDPSGFSLRTLMEEVSDLLAPRAHQKAVELTCRTDPEIPDRLIGDAGRIRQILTNLLGNAVKFTDQGEVNLEAELLGAEQDDVTLRILVRDTGIGIPADRHADAFESFTQVEGGNSRRHGGTGLGLTICKSIVALLGGEIGLESQPGLGSTFWFVLTLPRDPEGQDVLRTHLDSLRVLVVDDNETNGRDIQEALQSWGCRAETVRSGAEALARLTKSAERSPYDVVILDHDMPGMDGEETAQQIQAIPRLARIPLVLMTPLGSIVSEEESVTSPFFARLSKPLRRSSLYNLLCRLVSPDSALDPLPAPSSSEATLPRPLKILLAEDNDVNRRVAIGMIERLGGRVVAVGNGREAVAAWNQDRYDLILMDVQMPELDGLAATASIREAERAAGLWTPIIALTAHAMQGDRERCLAAGMDGYLTKPIRPAPLRETLIAWSLGLPRETIPPTLEATMFREEFLQEAFGGDPGLIREVIVLLLADSPVALGRLASAIAETDRRQIAWEAHSLRGVFLTVGAEALSAACAELETLSEHGDPNALRRVYETILDLWRQVEAASIEYLERLTSNVAPWAG